MRNWILIFLLIGKINIIFAYEVYDSSLISKILAYSAHDFDGLSSIKDFQNKSPIQFSINVTKKLEPTQLSKIKIKDDVVTLNIHPDALKNPWVTKEIIEEMRGLHLLHQKSDFYIYKEFLLNSSFDDSNAKMGIVAFEESATLRAHKLENSERIFDLIDGIHPQGDYDDYLHLRVSDLVNRRKSYKVSKEKINSSKINQNIFKDIYELSLKNDRKGVVKLLKSSISWNLLTETEKRAYKDFISSIEVPSKDKVFIFRGLGKFQAEDQIRAHGLLSKSIQNGALDEEISILRRNATSSDFYLPDLESRKWKWTHVDSFVASARLHGGYAKNTPFISTTSSLDIALSFSKEGYPKSSLRSVMLIEVSQNRLLPNIFSQFNELEYLVPFLIFPDEVKEVITGTDLEIKQRISNYRDEATSLFIDDSLSSFNQRGSLFFQRIQSCDSLLR
jgi:hypothetical protein